MQIVRTCNSNNNRMVDSVSRKLLQAVHIQWEIAELGTL